jgi:3-phenylpropionate/trans-cinnamate dioxygenase ferredoxin reductase component
MGARIVIVGAGQAGGWAPKTLRDSGYAGAIVLVGNEPHPPYERPPLSKAVLTAIKPPESCYLWSEERLQELRIEQRQDKVVAIDRQRRELTLASGAALGYDRLLLATGARPRRLVCPGADLPGVRYLRTIADSVEIGRSLTPGEHLLVVGGGWIGLEVAASAITKGCKVTVVEASDTLCGRSLPPVLGRYFLDLHAARGVDVRLNVRQLAFDGAGRLERALIGERESVAVTTAVVGIGVEPNTELAISCGLDVNNGIIVDERACSSDPDIFAAGDVANQHSAYTGRRVRFESWKNAQDHGIAAAKAMLEQQVPEPDVPWFWSDQYDINFQMLGIPSPHSTVYQKGSAAAGAFVHYFVQDGKLLAAAGVNSARDLREAKRAIRQGNSFEPGDDLRRLANT